MPCLQGFCREGIHRKPMTVLDLSSYDIPTLNDPACLASSGVSGVILGVFSPANPPYAMGAVHEALRDVGIQTLGFYGLPYFGSAWGRTRDTKWAVELALKYGVPRVWIDCEIDAYQVGFTDLSPVTPGSRVRDIQDCVNIIESAGLSAGIYSAPWWWIPNTSNTSQFSHLPLWFANYPADGHAMPILPQPFGGWTKPAIHQYTSTLYVCGRNRDANYVFEEQEMPDPRTDELIAAMGGIEAIREWNKRGNSLLAGYAIEQTEQNQVEADVAKLKVSALPDHTHEPGGVIRD